MDVTVRLSHDLARTVGLARVTLTLDEGATVADMISVLCQRYPDAATDLNAAIAFVRGRHVAVQESLEADQEVALLTPVGGGEV